MPIAKRFKRARLNGLAILAFAALATAVAVAARYAPVTSIAAGGMSNTCRRSTSVTGAPASPAPHFPQLTGSCTCS